MVSVPILTLGALPRILFAHPIIFYALLGWREKSEIPIFLLPSALLLDMPISSTVVQKYFSSRFASLWGDRHMHPSTTTSWTLIYELVEAS